jgi:hypothetical protein
LVTSAPFLAVTFWLPLGSVELLELLDVEVPRSEVVGRLAVVGFELEVVVVGLLEVVVGRLAVVVVGCVAEAPEFELPAGFGAAAGLGAAAGFAGAGALAGLDWPMDISVPEPSSALTRTIARRLVPRVLRVCIVIGSSSWVSSAYPWLVIG